MQSLAWKPAKKLLKPRNLPRVSMRAHSVGCLGRRNEYWSWELQQIHPVSVRRPVRCDLLGAGCRSNRCYLHVYWMVDSMNIKEIGDVFHFDCGFSGRAVKTVTIIALMVCLKRYGSWLRRMWRWKFIQPECFVGHVEVETFYDVEVTRYVNADGYEPKTWCYGAICNWATKNCWRMRGKMMNLNH